MVDSSTSLTLMRRQATPLIIKDIPVTLTLIHASRVRAQKHCSPDLTTIPRHLTRCALDRHEQTRREARHG